MRSDPARTARRALLGLVLVVCLAVAWSLLRPKPSPVAPRPAASPGAGTTVGDLQFLRFRDDNRKIDVKAKEAVQTGRRHDADARRRRLDAFRERGARGPADHSRGGVPVPARARPRRLQGQGPAADGRRLRARDRDPQVLGRQAARLHGRPAALQARRDVRNRHRARVPARRGAPVARERQGEDRGPAGRPGGHRVAVRDGLARGARLHLHRRGEGDAGGPRAPRQRPAAGHEPGHGRRRARHRHGQRGSRHRSRRRAARHRPRAARASGCGASGSRRSSAARACCSR